MQKHVNLVDLVKSFPTNIFLQNLALIQKRTSPVKFAHLAENQGKVRYRTFQLRFALNRALGLLQRRGVFCTEPFRLALAGSVDVALFDKTGTITTDSLIPAGVALLSNEKDTKQIAKQDSDGLLPFSKAPEDTVAVKE